MDDVIASISTPLGVGAIAVIRLSGEKSIEIANSICKNKNLLKKKTHTINYNYIVDGEELVDEVLISIMKSPNTYTGENVVEINTHGGIAITNKVLELLLLNGCRLSLPGEFTKRAFLNGKKDLIEAESVMNIISSKTEKARQIAINQLNGKTSILIRQFRKELADIISNIEVNIDYPEYDDIKNVTIDDINDKISKLETQIEKILLQSRDTKIIQEGINTLIIGKTNVGKSSLLNKLLNYEKAIVTDIEGTTRDIVEGEVIIDGILLNIIDTAGIRDTNDIVENIGIKKSLDLIEEAELILLVLNNNESLTNDDIKLMDLVKEKNHLIIVNKIDLKNKLEIKKLDKQKTVYISVEKDIGLDDLKKKIKEIFNLEKLEKQDLTYLSSARSISLLKKCFNNIKSIKQGIKENQPIDNIELDIKEIWQTLGEIIGESYTDELLDNIFSRFCLGK